MAQHDNGRRPGGTQSGAWQQGHREQQGGHHDLGSSTTGPQNQYDGNRSQQGDNWRERQGPAAGGWRPAMEERDRNWNDRSGQGSFGGQASDNDYGNRGITESGNFGNYGGGREDSYGAPTGQQRDGQGGNHDQGSQRFGSYRHGYDARSDSTGGYGGSDWNAQRAWRDEQRQRGNGGGSTYGQSSADNDQGGRGRQGNPASQDRYGDNGYQGNFQQGQRGQAYHDPDYHQWRSEQLSRLDRDYDDWRQHRYQRFADEFDQWRSSRGNDGGRAGAQAGATQADATPGAADKDKANDTSSTLGSSSSSGKK